ncbi:hypothetical protein P389DRAFT_169889 [Cystobasidium minutum MCA 4210]|uniref:uncharacterized protein n=1 Tax=Cystobasidium minutum MCA 4210 TaxID=1397322 RepID=UPI0034CD609C|eukprot:jgi/Rhomi1/169889/fgenesh1_kg.3_\
MSQQSSTMKAAAAQASIAPKPRSKQDSSLHTPSWTDIVSAYHAEGNGDREMLLALLNAKAKEDERLAALDLLRAEQLRAYTAHLAVHGPLYPPSAQRQPYPGHGQAHLRQPQQHHASSSSSSSSSSSTTFTKTRKRNPTSRSPSLSNSSESRLSSPELVKTPDDERRLSGLSISDKDALILPPPNNLKRKSPEAVAYPEEGGNRSAKRVSPPRQLPSIADLLPASQAVDNHHQHQSSMQSEQEAKRASSPRSLQHILNQELRPLMSLGGYRAQTSDVRSSSSDEDELAEA